MSDMNAPEPPPTPNVSLPVWEMVIADMHARDLVGRERYGMPLQAGNGRNALVDAYQESLDLVVYLRQVIAEDWRERALEAEREIEDLRRKYDAACQRIGKQSEIITSLVSGGRRPPDGDVPTHSAARQQP